MTCNCGDGWMFDSVMVRQVLSMALSGLVPDGSSKRLADTDANTNSDTDNQKRKNELADDSVSGTHVGHEITSLLLGELRVLLPFVPPGPHLAITLGEGFGLVHARALGGVDGSHSLEVGVEGIGTLIGMRC